ncbi:MULTISPECIES: hypothetical protein [unclassified Thiomonas]|uniref:hypothetical protein n=1 Tax=unclassified Thiomonas TaxID=2625466 RepID=UPI0007C24C0F|nr:MULTISPECIES: hypothetical protein [unclassified Thiomonas]CQR41979.1 hypothetical protein THICB3110548 [Thiomonas sp. CB3]VDY03541.1 protein of unknown function [Thiomonas sp. Bio17B3]VDY09283.1 protein of unknown function [Thiomonas sp. Sup16B3]VDY11790.1 conserved protein of unknown function [Thiomonas sp. OC7]VDY18993.1 protein of unknown function [Thiomonas sp. CB2]
MFTVPSSVNFDAPVELLWYALLGVLSGVMAAILPTVFYRLRDEFRALPTGVRQLRS